jgi:hypothetical protein
MQSFFNTIKCIQHYKHFANSGFDSKIFLSTGQFDARSGKRKGKNMNLKIDLHLLRNGPEKLDKDSLFDLFLKLVQINYITCFLYVRQCTYFVYVLTDCYYVTNAIIR